MNCADIGHLCTSVTGHLLPKSQEIEASEVARRINGHGESGGRGGLPPDHCHGRRRRRPRHPRGESPAPGTYVKMFFSSCIITSRSRIQSTRVYGTSRGLNLQGRRLRILFIECRQPVRRAYELGVAAAAVLAASHAIANVVGGCSCACSRDRRATPNRQMASFALVISWYSTPPSFSSSSSFSCMHLVQDSRMLVQEQIVYGF